MISLSLSQMTTPTKRNFSGEQETKDEEKLSIWVGSRQRGEMLYLVLLSVPKEYCFIAEKAFNFATAGVPCLSSLL